MTENCASFQNHCLPLAESQVWPEPFTHLRPGFCPVIPLDQAVKVVKKFINMEDQTLVLSGNAKRVSLGSTHGLCLHFNIVNDIAMLSGWEWHDWGFKIDKYSMILPLPPLELMKIRWRVIPSEYDSDFFQKIEMIEETV